LKQGHCTAHALSRITESITNGFNNKKATLVPFLDIERSFDILWLTGLIPKLMKAGFPSQFVHNDLNNGAFTVVHGYFESTRRPLLAGVPQGSLLGPVFLVFK
jgi:hypothetical protein